MKFSLAVVAVVATVAIAGCENRTDAPAPETSAAPSTANIAPPASAPIPGPATDAVSTVPAPAGAPGFAAVYPGGELQGEPLTATGATGPGGVVTFTTDAQPEAVIAFYRQRAEAAGLATMMSLNQGEARAYGAQAQATGASVNVVAAPAEERTSVQLTWTAGQ